MLFFRKKEVNIQDEKINQLNIDTKNERFVIKPKNNTQKITRVYYNKNTNMLSFEIRNIAKGRPKKIMQERKEKKMKMTDLFNTVIFHELKSDIVLTDEERETLNKLHYKYLETKMTETRFSLTYEDLKFLKLMYDKSIKANSNRALKDMTNRRISKRIARYRHNYRFIIRLICDMERMRKMLGI